VDPREVEISFFFKQISVSIFDKYCEIQTNLSLMSGVFYFILFYFILFYICTYIKYRNIITFINDQVGISIFTHSL